MKVGAFTPAVEGWRGWVENNPSINTLGRTLLETKENLKAAIRAHDAEQDDQENGAFQREDPTSTSRVNKYIPQLLSKKWVRL